MAKITNPDDMLSTNGPTLRAYRQGLVDRFTGQGHASDKAIEAAKLIEAYVVEGATDEDRDQRRVTIERQIGMTSDVAKAVAAAKALDAYVNGKAA